MPLAPEEMQELFTERLGEHVVGSEIQWGQFTLTVDAEGYVEAARIAKEDDELACDFFDCISGVDEREDGFSVVAILYSTEHHHRVLLKHLCGGGRDNPVAPSLTPLYRGADWHEREAWDMFGIEFEGHPGLAPRILTTENFEGWPLRKDFYLATREAKPWPGVKEPLELDEEGNVIEREKIADPGAAPGPMELDEAMGEQAKRVAGLLDQETVEVGAGGEEKEVEAEAAEQAKQEPDTYPAGEETRSERAERAVEGSEREGPDEVIETGQGGPPGVTAVPDEEPRPGTTPLGERTRGTTTGGGPGSQPPQASDEPVPGAEAGEPPTAQEPGEAPVDAGVHESPDEAADAGPGPSGGERPGSDEATDASSSSRSGSTPDQDPSSSSDNGRTPDEEDDG